jgi:hypothetical protein
MASSVAEDGPRAQLLALVMAGAKEGSHNTPPPDLLRSKEVGRSSALASATTSSLSPCATPFHLTGSLAGRSKACRWAEDSIAEDSNEENPLAASSSLYLDVVCWQQQLPPGLTRAAQEQPPMAIGACAMPLLLGCTGSPSVAEHDHSSSTGYLSAVGDVGSGVSWATNDGS